MRSRDPRRKSRRYRVCRDHPLKFQELESPNPLVIVHHAIRRGSEGRQFHARNPACEPLCVQHRRTNSVLIGG